MVGHDGGVNTIEVEGTIRLGQFLQLAQLADSGAHARKLVATGEVSVNGEVDLRRGRQLHPGDVVTVGRTSISVG